MVRNTFFRTDWPDYDIQSNASWMQDIVRNQIVALRKTRRESMIFMVFMRSKYIVWARAAVMVGVHFPWELMHGMSKVAVDADIALLHHYRRWNENETEVPKDAVVDERLPEFAERIVRRVAARHDQLSRAKTDSTERLQDASNLGQDSRTRISG